MIILLYFLVHFALCEYSSVQLRKLCYLIVCNDYNLILHNCVFCILNVPLLGICQLVMINLYRTSLRKVGGGDVVCWGLGQSKVCRLIYLHSQC